MPPAYFLPDFRDAVVAFDKIAGWFARGVHDPLHPFRTITVATTGLGGHPEARTVVLRAFDPLARVAWFHTDVRSPKMRQLAADARLTLLAYDPDAKVQARLPAVATIHVNNEVARDHWTRLHAGSRATYTTAFGGGEELPADAPVEPDTPVAADDPAFAHFAAVACRFDTLEVLELKPDGHRRARLTWAGTGWTMVRLAP